MHITVPGVSSQQTLLKHQNTMEENYQFWRDEEALQVNPPHDARILWVQCGYYVELNISHINLVNILVSRALDIAELRDETRMMVELMR